MTPIGEHDPVLHVHCKTRGEKMMHLSSRHFGQTVRFHVGFLDDTLF